MKAIKLAFLLLLHPTYRVIMCAKGEMLRPSPWADSITVDVDKEHKVIRLWGEFL